MTTTVKQDWETILTTVKAQPDGVLPVTFADHLYVGKEKTLELVANDSDWVLAIRTPYPCSPGYRDLAELFYQESNDSLQIRYNPDLPQIETMGKDISRYATALSTSKDVENFMSQVFTLVKPPTDETPLH